MRARVLLQNQAARVGGRARGGSCRERGDACCSGESRQGGPALLLLQGLAAGGCMRERRECQPAGPGSGRPWAASSKLARLGASISTSLRTPCRGRRCREFFQSGKTLPIERGAGPDQPVMHTVAREVAAGRWLHIFPEVRRSAAWRSTARYCTQCVAVQYCALWPGWCMCGHSRGEPDARAEERARQAATGIAQEAATGASTWARGPCCLQGGGCACL